MLKEILFFSGGDSNDPLLWSNVPCLYSRTLEKKGYAVHRVNYSPPLYLIRIYNHLSWWFTKITKRVVTVPVTQTFFYCYLAQLKVNKALKKYKSADLCIFMGNNGVVNFKDYRPSIIFCESEFGYLIRRDYKRKPNWIEMKSVMRDRKALLKANLVTILFPYAIESVRKLSASINVKYHNGNVINSFFDGELNESEILASKAKYNLILFVGGGHYREAAEMTINAFRILKADHKDLELHIIGMTEDMFDNLPSDVVCHGYLNKDNKEENKAYYSLLQRAKVYTNPTPKWGAYSSCVESMYFYTPCVVHPYQHFVNEFGKDMIFGCYNEEFTPEGVAQSLESVLFSEDYTSLARNAHEKVKDYTWDKYIDWTFQELLKTIDNRR